MLDIRAPAGAGSALRRESASIRGAVREWLAATGIAGAEQMHGKELSYNNLVDLDAAWQLIAGVRRAGRRPSSSTPIRAAARRRRTLARRATGGRSKPIRYRPTAACWRSIAPWTAETAAEIAKTFIEAIAAPGLRQRSVADSAREKESAAVAGGPRRRPDWW